MDLDIAFEIVAHNDGILDPDDDEHDENYPPFGRGQRSGLKRMLRALDDWQKGK